MSDARRPVVTIAAAIAIAAGFCAELAVGVDAWRPGASELARAGGGPDAGLGWRLGLAPLVHLGALHLAFNLIGFALIGPPLERALGRAAAAIVLVGGALAGAALHLAVQPYDLSVGASGATFAGAAATAIVAIRTRGRELGVRLAVFAALQVVAAIAARPDLLAHAGGIAAGLAIALVAGPRPARLRTVAAAAAITAGIAALVAISRPPLDYRGDLARAAELERRFDTIVPETITGAQPDLARRLEVEVVAPLADLRAHLTDDPRMPAAIARRRAALRAYLDARLRAFRSIERYLETGDASLRAEIDAANRDADRALSE